MFNNRQSVNYYRQYTGNEKGIKGFKGEEKEEALRVVMV